MLLIKAMLVAWLCSWGAVHASNALINVKSVAILIENLDEDAGKCGVTKDALDAAVRLPVANSRIHVDPRALAYLYVNVNMLRVNNTCVASYSLSFNKYVVNELATGSFWEKGSIITGSPSFVSRGITDELESFAKQFVAAWLKVN